MWIRNNFTWLLASRLDKHLLEELLSSVLQANSEANFIPFQTLPLNWAHFALFSLKAVFACFSVVLIFDGLCEDWKVLSGTIITEAEPPNWMQFCCRDSTTACLLWFIYVWGCFKTCSLAKCDVSVIYWAIDPYELLCEGFTSNSVTERQMTCKWKLSPNIYVWIKAKPMCSAMLQGKLCWEQSQKSLRLSYVDWWLRAHH